MTSHRIRVLGGVAAGVLVFSACGDPEQESNASPLQEIWGEPESPAESRAKQLEVEEVTAQCMKDEGWEYTPVDYSAQFPGPTEQEDPTDPSYGEKYGYGIVHNYEIYELPNLDENGEYVGSDEGFEDPNGEYVNSLSMDEQQEYYAALYGDQMNQEPEIDPETGEEIWVQPPPEERGCNGMAWYEVNGEQPWDDQEFNERFSELNEQMMNDPALEDADIVWSDCMYEIDEDYDFFSSNDTWQYMDTLLNEAKGLERVPIDPETWEVIGGTGEENIVMSMQEEGGDAWGYVGEQKRLTEAQLERLLEQELALWNADQECQEESGLKDLRRQLEQDIVDTIREEFPDLLQDDA